MSAPTSSHTMAGQLIDNAKYLLTSCLTVLAQMSLGQVLLRALDRGFWIIEKSAQWSLPYHESVTEENGKFLQSMELVRPLPWVLFLPGLIVLRLCRFGWNLGAVIFGYPTIEPSDIVKYIQKIRRRLRTIKTNGIKTLRQKRVANHRPLSVTSDEKSATESTIATFRTIDQKRKYAQISSDDQETDESEDENLNSKIERLARESSIHDEDFEPEESSDSTESSQTDLEDEDKNISQDEVEHLIQENEHLAIHQFVFSNSVRHSANDTQDTCPTNNKKNPEIELAEEQRNYFSPQSGDDGETAFYSPISSKSASPERVIPTFKGHQNEDGVEQLEAVEENYKADVDGKIVEKSNGHAETTGSEQTVNTNKCASKFQNKSYHHKGKRMNHGSRKKK
ncbi:uncharacterized protein LOC107042131 isoform X3 [Diachasma alloeum]|uniref:uncharacterized protein LOC107042131 isoform X3 n=1 Tax=Diachasma alloeum TaxID=454923 RepID=UPI00073850E3|nr:uncharacterized protein LOC107042131 isoform X3 [Diachasma alloeum]